MGNAVDIQGNVELRIKKVKKAVKKIFSGNYETLDEAMLLVRWQVANYWRIPLFSKMWEDYTLEDLIMEYEIIKFSTRTEGEKVKEAVAESKEEIDDLFSDWEKEDGWVNVEPEISEDQLKEIERKFMTTGEFSNEK